MRETRTIHSASLRQQPLLQCWSDVELLDSLLDGRLLVGSLHTAQQRGWGAFDVVDRPGVELGSAALIFWRLATSWIGDFASWSRQRLLQRIDVSDRAVSSMQYHANVISAI